MEGILANKLTSPPKNKAGRAQFLLQPNHLLLVSSLTMPEQPVKTVHTAYSECETKN